MTAISAPLEYRKHVIYWKKQEKLLDEDENENKREVRIPEEQKRKFRSTITMLRNSRIMAARAIQMLKSLLDEQQDQD